MGPGLGSLGDTRTIREEAEADGRLLSSSGSGPAAPGSGDRRGVRRAGSALWVVAVDGPDPVHSGVAGDSGEPADRLPDPVGAHALGVGAGDTAPPRDDRTACLEG